MVSKLAAKSASILKQRRDQALAAAVGRIEGYTTCGTINFDIICVMSSTPCFESCAWCGSLNNFGLATVPASSNL